MNDQKRHEEQADEGIRGTGMAYSALDHLSTPMMMVDRSFVIRFANQASFAMLRKHEAVLAQRFPGFRVDRLVGTNFDTFHKDPSRQRSLLSDARNLPFKGEMSLGGLTFSITVNATRAAGGEISGYALEWHDVTEQRKRDGELMRVKQAVQNASVPLMLVDRDLVITYVNDATMRLMRDKESILRTVFRSFSADALVGTCIDSFHANPSHQRKLLADPKNLPYATTIKVGPLRFRLNVTAITDPAGNYIGNTLEWNDVTAQVAAEDEVQKLIESAAAGRLEERIDVTAWSGFVKTMGAGLNELLEAVSRPIKEVTVAAQALAQGDLTHSIDGDYQGEFGTLVEALNACTQNLRDMVGSIRESASTVAQGAAELSEGNTNLSSRTQEQAAALEETASTVAEMTVTVKRNAETARNANDLATDARQVAEKGGEVVDKAVQAMAAIRDSSKKIEDIIAVIDEIAFQTNLLALNAAVEAARAGDQGRGFAVVAAEVRSLAQRSAGAAKEIKTLIKDSVEKVDLGTKLVDHSGSTLLDIVKGVKKVSDMVESIASASTEQAAGIEQVNKAISQMEEAVQQNAALVEEAAAASASMDDQAKSLQELMGNFVVEEADAYEEPEPPPPPPRRARPAAAVGRTNGHGNGHAPRANGQAPKANGHAHARPASPAKAPPPAPPRAARPAPKAAHRNGKANGHAHVEEEHWESF